MAAYERTTWRTCMCARVRVCVRVRTCARVCAGAHMCACVISEINTLLRVYAISLSIHYIYTHRFF